MKRIMEFVGSLLTGSFVIIFAIFGILSLPFATIAMKNWFELSWPMAIISAILVNIVPMFGQLIFLFFAIVGAVLWIQADFSFENAAYARSEQSEYYAFMTDWCMQGREDFFDHLPKHLTVKFDDNGYANYCGCIADSMPYELKRQGVANKSEIDRSIWESSLRNVTTKCFRDLAS